MSFAFKKGIQRIKKRVKLDKYILERVHKSQKNKIEKQIFLVLFFLRSRKNKAAYKFTSLKN